MRKVTEEHYVPAKTYTTTKYIASDGKEFYDQASCLWYEERLEIEKHPVFQSQIRDASIPDGDCANLFYLRNQEDLEFLKKYMGRGQWTADFDTYGEGWYLFYQIDGGDYPDSLHLHNYLAYEKTEQERLDRWKSEMRSLLL